MSIHSHGNRIWIVILVLLIAAAFTLSTVSCDKKEKAAPVKKVETKKEVKKSKRELRMKVDLDAMPNDLEGAVKAIRAAQKWKSRKKNVLKEIPAGTLDLREYMNLKMNRNTFLESFRMGTAFLVKNQKPEGNFGYMYDWLTKEWVSGDNQVRQAGALWGLALCNREKPDLKVEKALKKGLEFWFKQTIDGPEGTITVRYQNENSTSQGTVALVALSIIEYLTTDIKIPSKEKKELETKLKGYLDFLKWMQLDNGQFAKSYNTLSQTKASFSSPYFDGESMLALAKAANRLGYKDLVPAIEKAARGCAETYLVKAWKDRRDNKATKGFYQWGSMSYAEYYFARWKDYDLYGDVTVALGWWMSHVHQTLKRGRNHAYALEGLVSAYRIAKDRKDTAAMVDLLYVIDRSFYKLTAWQIGGPLADKNEFLIANPTDDPVAMGGIMNSAKAISPRPRKAGDTQHELRIDVTQHQMHSVILAMRYVYTAEKQ